MAETPDGHAGRYIVHAAELPDSLPAEGPLADRGAHVAPSVLNHAGPPDKENDLRDQLAELSTQIDAFVGKSMNPTNVSAFATF